MLGETNRGRRVAFIMGKGIKKKAKKILKKFKKNSRKHKKRNITNWAARRALTRNISRKKRIRS